MLVDRDLSVEPIQRDGSPGSRGTSFGVPNDRPVVDTCRHRGRRLRWLQQKRSEAVAVDFCGHSLRLSHGCVADSTLSVPTIKFASNTNNVKQREPPVG